MRHSINTNLLQSIITYLASKPYSEVMAIIEQIQKDATAIEDANAPKLVKDSNEN